MFGGGFGILGWGRDSRRILRGGRAANRNRISGNFSKIEGRAMGEFRPGEDRRAALERALVSYRSYLHVVAAGKLKGREGGIESASDFVQMTMAGAIRDIREGKGPANEEE